MKPRSATALRIQDSAETRSRVTRGETSQQEGPDRVRSVPLGRREIQQGPRHRPSGCPANWTAYGCSLLRCDSMAKISDFKRPVHISPEKDLPKGESMPYEPNRLEIAGAAIWQRASRPIRSRRHRQMARDSGWMAEPGQPLHGRGTSSPCLAGIAGARFPAWDCGRDARDPSLVPTARTTGERLAFLGMIICDRDRHPTISESLTPRLFINAAACLARIRSAAAARASTTIPGVFSAAPHQLRFPDHLQQHEPAGISLPIWLSAPHQLWLCPTHRAKVKSFPPHSRKPFPMPAW